MTLGTNMLLACILALCSVFQNNQSNQDLADELISRDVSSEIAELLAQLAPPGIKLKTWYGSPDPEEIERIRTRLIQIANRSPQARNSVIKALIPILNTPKGEFDLQEVDKWRTAVGLLGELNAVEAIDDLVRNIGHTSYQGLPHPTPPVRAALVHIGEPAVPSLLKALAGPDELPRWESTEALIEVGTPSVQGLLEVLAVGNPGARAAAAYALAMLRSPFSRESIEIAVRLESNEELRKHFESALKLMDHLERLASVTKQPKE